MTTDEIYNKITTRALEAAEKDLRSACNNFIKGLGLQGTCERLKTRAVIKGSDIWQDVEIRTDLLMEDIVQGMLAKRKKYIEQEAVNQFLSSVDTFKQQMSYLEQYNLDN